MWLPIKLNATTTARNDTAFDIAFIAVS